MNEKEQFRKEFKEKRLSISTDEVKEKSMQIMERLFSSEAYKAAKTVMFYVSKANEVFTHDMIKRALNDKVVCVPKTNLKTKSIDAYSIKGFEQLSVGTFYVMEPTEEAELIEPSEIDIIILPGLVFDRKGNRLGYGIGYYDKFLKKAGAKKIGLAFDFQIAEKVPTEEHDVPMDVIVTEKEIVNC